MNDETTNLDQIDEDILIHAVSDDALEAAAGNSRASMSVGLLICFGCLAR